MSLSVGIVGLPNVGKSTLFNALNKRQMAYAANFPFATIEPNIGVVPVPDERLDKLATVVAESEKMAAPPPLVQSTVEFVDIAGLVAGAHRGEGLGNKFLAHIREVSAICHVVRDFVDPEIVREGATTPDSDLKVIETELMLADLQTVENQSERLRGNVKPALKSAVAKLAEALAKGVPARDVELASDEQIEAKQLSLLTAKPILVVLNTDEDLLAEANKRELAFARSVELHADQVVVISAKIESELASLDDADQKTYMEEVGMKSDGLTRLITKAYATLGLISFLTAGGKEVRAWTIKAGSLAPQAAGTIHTDFEAKFIKANVVKFADFVELGGWAKAAEAGKVRVEGRTYVMQDGDVVEFKVGS